MKFDSVTTAAYGVGGCRLQINFISQINFVMISLFSLCLFLYLGKFCVLDPFFQQS